MENYKSSTYCRELIRKHDPDRFLLSLFAPVDRREAVWAVLAFNYEIAKTREVVSETQLGLIRLQWWREEIGKIYSGVEVLENEVLQALAAAIQAYDLPQEAFERLIYGREFDLEDVLPADVEGMMTYLEAVNGALGKILFYIMQRREARGVSLGGDEEQGDEVMAARVAVMYGLVGLLRAVPFHAYQERCLLPQNLLQAHGVSLNKLYQGREVEALRPVVEELLERFEVYRPRGRFFKAMNFFSRLCFKQLKSNGFDVFQAANARPPAFLALRLFFAAYF